MYQNYMNKPGFMTNTSNASFGGGSNLFGQPQQPSTSGLFGGGGNAFGQNKATFGFGAQPPAQPSLFGQQPQQPQQPVSTPFQSNTSNLFGGGSNAFGSQVHTGTVIKFAPVAGTDTMQKNGVAQSISTKHHCISCMKEYENKSLEELRSEDYSANRKGPQQQSGFSSTPFGATVAPQPTSLFGQTDNKSGFGQAAGFGQASSFGQPAPSSFASQAATPSLFGKPSFGAPTSTTTSFGFNSTPAAAANPFGAAQAAKPFSQPLFPSATQPQPGFGGGVFGQANTQSPSTNLFQKPAQPTTGFNTAPGGGFSFSQPASTQAPNLFQQAKPSTGFGVFGQTNTGTPQFGQPAQPAFGTGGFGAKPATSTFAQPAQTQFGGTLGGMQAQPQQFMFGGSMGAAKPSMFGTMPPAKPAGGMFMFQQPTNSFSMGAQPQQQQLQQGQFPPEPSDDLRNISLIATDSFPDGPHVYGLEPILSNPSNSATNPKDIKAMLDYSKREEMGGTGAKIKVHLPKSKRGSNYNREFFETSQALKSSHKCLVIRKFNSASGSIYNKYKNELLEEAEESLRRDSPRDEPAPSPRLASPEQPSPSTAHPDPEPKPRTNGLRLQFDSTLGDEPSLIGIPESDLTLPDCEIVEAEQPEPCNLAGVILTKPEYYMFPAPKDLDQYLDSAGACIVQGLTIGRRGYGNVFFPDPIDVSNLNLDEIVHFRHREVIVYPDDTKKPAVGTGLNRPAQVTLDKIFPREKDTGVYITDVNQIISSNFVDNLMQVTQKHNCKFVDYRPQTGSWGFKVKHFSKYAFTDSDEEECEVLADKGVGKKPAEGLKKIDEVEEGKPGKLGLGGKEKLEQFGGTRIYPNIDIDIETQDISDDLEAMDYWHEEQYMSRSIFKPETSCIQAAKISLFSSFNQAPEVKRGELIAKRAELPSEVISNPRVRKIPDLSLAVLPENITSTQRCYTELGIFRNNTFKVGWNKGFKFYNFNNFVDNDVVYALTQCNIRVEATSFYTAMLPDITDALQVALEATDFKFDSASIPTLSIKHDVTYLQNQTTLFSDYVRAKTLTGKDKYLSSVWNLCTALWGAGDASEFGRRQALSAWLKQAAFDLSDEGGVADSQVFAQLFELLSFFKIAEASEFAAKNRLSQLSLLVAQLSNNERVKLWLKKYIEGFAWKEEGVIPEEFKRVYLLISGIPVNGRINVCQDLDWMRCLGLHLWYVAPAAAPIHYAFKQYRKAFEELEYASEPIPPYCKAPGLSNYYDLLYHILALYCDSTYQLCELLHPETHTDHIMDYRFSWFMLQLFVSLRVGLVRDSEKEHLHATFSTQLENMGLWKWAVFALLFLEDNVIKRNLVMGVLDRNVAVFNETGDIEHELVTVFKVPARWIHEVKATKARAAGYYYEYYQHYLHMGNWQEANYAFVEHILPELFINEHFEDLSRCIAQLSPKANVLADWDSQAGIVREFLEVHELFRENGDAVRFVGSRLNVLCKRIHSFPLKNDKQKLCVAELSRKCALLFKIFLKRIGDENFRERYMDVINTLVMPPDFKQYEIFHLISNFVQHEAT